METLPPGQARAMIGAEPEGDPDGMRALAAQLRCTAHRLGSRANVRLSHWESDEGRRVKARIAGALRLADGTARNLLGAADFLEREADAVAAAKVRWATRYSELVNRGSGIPEGKI
ncbi:hypothetical protein [Actinomadura decatromicini]|uniref:Uncharacterized protein n=1 Tax=Actinomadura decatromicini TaxID=2604572 RepID=A0A5D3F3P7_9ACTN|nr:hypothetical protein [Actinomadura decatromicini]TYK43637.1 hypothetical protein FXF68_36395 [Actinomadura decatromicini]